MGTCTEMLMERDGGLQKPGFFKVLMPGFEKKLRIPPAFVKYITNLRDKRATLISPLGNLWSVNIHGCKEKMCFREGWPEFAQAHDLKLGCFMVFGYEDDRTFSFQVFDTSACRKDYSPVGVQSVARMDIRQDLNSEDASEDTSQGPMTQGSRKQIRMMDEGRPLTERTFSSCSGRKSFVAIISDYNLNRNYMSIPASFKESSDIMTKDEVILKDGEGRSWHVSICKRGKKGAFLAKGWRDFCVGNRLGEGDKCIFELASNEKDNIMLVRILKDSCNRLNEEKSFEVIVKDFNLTKPYMSIPASFRASNDIATKHQVILKDVEGRSWHVRVCNKGKRGVHLAEGWQEFCADHRLERGDKCIFELVSMEDNTLLVQIFKQMTQSCSRCMNQEEHSFSDHLDATRIHFLKTVDSDFSQQMIIPKKFVKNFKEELSQNILLRDPSGNLWRVRLLKDAEDMILENGWEQFVDAHSIKEDDHLVFKYNGDSCFNVLIFDQTGCEKEACYFIKDPMGKVNESCQSEKDIAKSSLKILQESLPPKACARYSSKALLNDRKPVPYLLATEKFPQVNEHIADNIMSVKSTILKRKTRDDSLSSNSMNEHEQNVRFVKVVKHSVEQELPVTSRRRLVTEKVVSYLVNDPQHEACELYQFGRANREDSLKIFPETFPLEGYDFCSSKRLQDDKQPVPHLLATRKSLQVNVKIADNTLSIKSAHSKIRNKGEKLSSNSMRAKEQTIRCKKVMNHCIEQELQLTSAMRLVTKEKKAQAWQKADAIQPTNPFFKKAMLRDAVNDRFRMYIPKQFAAKHLGHEQQTIVCSLPNGKETWNVNYKVYDEFSQFCGQWQKFAQDNGLEEGDVCIFELTRAHKDLAMDVHIFRVLDKNTPLHRGRRRIPMKREGSFLRIDG